MQLREKLIDIAFFLHLEIINVFGNTSLPLSYKYLWLSKETFARVISAKFNDVEFGAFDPPMQVIIRLPAGHFLLPIIMI